MTFDIYLTGRVQGVGFRPFVYILAQKMNVCGIVSNEPDGVHITLTTETKQQAQSFLDSILHQAPAQARITFSAIQQIESRTFSDFQIVPTQQHITQKQSGFLAPDFGLCQQCRQEINDPSNRRHHYAFTSCTNCGPRYSILQQMPYDREKTTMHKFVMCSTCHQEYDDVFNRRFFSQTNSCSDCGIQLFWKTKDQCLPLGIEQISAQFKTQIAAQKIIAVKGLGGFLLLCDTSVSATIETLRHRKHRPSKPFALIFRNIEMLKEYAVLQKQDANILQNQIAPIVLLQTKEKCFEKLAMNSIAPNLKTIGAMLPYTPLLELLLSNTTQPLVATSANKSGSWIIYDSKDSDELFAYADIVIDHNLEIIMPQDDSVIKHTHTQQSIVLRRSRSFAPSIFDIKTKLSKSVLAFGADMKSSFALFQNEQYYVSQFLGSLGSYDAEQQFKQTLKHLTTMLHFKPKIFVCDLHPHYTSTRLAIEMAHENNIPFVQVQHHEAHFAAILGEHNLIDCPERILGVVFDGTGWGKDGTIWGGEFFVYQHFQIERIHHIEQFVHVANDKMAQLPKLCALSICSENQSAQILLDEKFTPQEQLFYKKTIAKKGLVSSSMGRYFDAVAALLNVCNENAYEGEAAMQIEQMAAEYFGTYGYEKGESYFAQCNHDTIIPMKKIIDEIVLDAIKGVDKKRIVAQFYQSIVDIIEQVRQVQGITKICFSGGVFQNAVLVDLLCVQLQKTNTLFFHEQLSPNDENISFGQLLFLAIEENRQK